MMATIELPVLFGQNDRWRDMGAGFRGEKAQLSFAELFTSVSIIVAVILTLWLLSRLMTRREGRRLYNHPRHLFRSLCRAHGLSGAEQRLLRQVAVTRQIANPSGLFLDYEALEQARWDPRLKRHSDLIANLCDRLFLETPVADDPAQGRVATVHEPPLIAASGR